MSKPKTEYMEYKFSTKSRNRNERPVSLDGQEIPKGDNF